MVADPSDSQEANKSSTPSSKSKKIRRTYRQWREILPGSKRDYFLILIAAVDMFLLAIRQAYSDFLSREVSTAIIVFDLVVIALWFLDLLNRARKEKDRAHFIKRNWYEFLGLIPLFIFRPLLLLRAAKMAIAFYKIGKSEQDVSSLLTRDITFRFRDIIVDTISDAVFLRSLQRVEEVMIRLDYADLARNAFREHSEELSRVVHESLNSKSIIGDLTKLPFMSGVANRLGDDLSMVIMEILETEVTGDIMKAITRGILQEMTERVKRLDVERITGQDRPEREDEESLTL